MAAVPGHSWHQPRRRAAARLPGEVPSQIPPAQWWPLQGFDFQAFRPLPMSAHQALPHIRLDAALEFLLGDHLE